MRDMAEGVKNRRSRAGASLRPALSPRYGCSESLGPELLGGGRPRRDPVGSIGHPYPALAKKLNLPF